MSITNNLIPVPFANSASSTWKYNIPNTLASTDTANKACWDVGFPAITMTDIAAGGIPFYGQDVNGVLNAITIAIRYIQAGNFQVYDSSFATSIGGYNKVSVIKGSDGNLYQSTIDGNTTNPVGGTNWKTFGSGNYLPLAGGTVTGTTDFTGTLQYKGVEVLKLGDYGLGSSGLTDTSNIFIDDITKNKCGNYVSKVANHPESLSSLPQSNGYYGAVVVYRGSNTSSSYPGYAFRLFDTATGNSLNRNLYIQRYAGTDGWQNPEQIITTANVASYAGKSVVVETYKSSDGLNWYRKWSDGWIEQGGTVSGTATINLLKVFSDTNYTLTFGATNGNGVPRSLNRTASSFDFASANYLDTKANWLACGY